MCNQQLAFFLMHLTGREEGRETERGQLSTFHNSQNVQGCVTEARRPAGSQSLSYMAGAQVFELLLAASHFVY